MRLREINRRRITGIALYVAVLAATGYFLWQSVTRRSSEVVRISVSRLSPFSDSMSLHPAVDAKLTILRNDFNYREAGARSVPRLLAEGEFSKAYKRAYLENNGKAMTEVFDRFRAHRSALDGEEDSEGSYGSAAMLDAIDETLLFEAYIYEASGQPALALQRYSKYLDLLRRLRSGDFDPVFRDVEARLTYARLKIYLLEHHVRQYRPNEMPFLQRLGGSFLENGPVSLADYRKILATLEPKEGPSAAVRAQKPAALLDYCLDKFGPHRSDVGTEPADECTAETVTARFHGFGLPSAVVAHNRLHNQLHRDYHAEAEEAAWQEAEGFEYPSVPAPRFAPALRANYEQGRIAVEALIRRINSEAPDATFLIDDMIELLAEHVSTNRSYIFSPAELAAGRDTAEIHRVICDIAPVTSSISAEFDKRGALMARLGAGQQCSN